MKIEHINVLNADIEGADIDSLAAQLVGLLTQKEMTVASAESCTGGLFGAKITAVAGASAVYRGGVISYTNDAKMTMLGVSEGSLCEHTAVSAEVAAEMAHGVMSWLGSDFGVSVTGYAGPLGGDEINPVGTVFVCIADSCGERVTRLSFELGCTREQIREYSVFFILSELQKKC